LGYETFGVRYQTSTLASCVMRTHQLNHTGIVVFLLLLVSLKIALGIQIGIGLASFSEKLVA